MKLKFKLVVRRLTGVEAIKKKAPNPLPGSSYPSTWDYGLQQRRGSAAAGFLSPIPHFPNKAAQQNHLLAPALPQSTVTPGAVSKHSCTAPAPAFHFFLHAGRTLQQRERKDFSSPTFPALCRKHQSLCTPSHRTHKPAFPLVTSGHRHHAWLCLQPN